MKQSMKASRQLALWSEPRDRFQPSEAMREEVTRALAELLLAALGVKASANQSGDDDELQDHV